MTASASDNLPLSDLRVVEIGSGEALSYCGKLFSDFGADVIKIEPPEGDPGRRRGPMVDVGGGNKESGSFAWANTNKRSVTADLSSEAGSSKVRDILTTADLLLDARHIENIRSSRLSHDELRKTDPGLAITALSWFAEYGPYRNWQATESTIRSLMGLVKQIGPAEGPPMLPREGQTAIITALSAFIPTISGLYSRERGARRYSVNAQEALLQISGYDLCLAQELGYSRKRSGVNSFGRNFPGGSYMTKEGWLGVTVVTIQQWRAFAKMIGHPELGDNPAYAIGALRFNHAAALDKIIAPILRERTAVEWFERALELKIPLVVIPDMKTLLAQSFHRERRAFGDITIGTATFEGPTLPHHLTGSMPLANGRAPVAGEDNDKPLAKHARVAKGAVPANAELPLSGLRVIDLAMGWAGPSASRQLADLGADVIKVESPSYADWFRGTDQRPPYHVEKTYEKELKFQLMNRNKRGIALDLTKPEGTALLKRLLADAHVVLDSYSADVMPKLGLTADALLAVNPKLVVTTMPAYGMKGPWSSLRAYGSTLEQGSGLPTVTGREEDPPAMNHAVYGDPIGGLNAAVAIMIGVMHQKRTGKGQHIDLSQVQGLLPMVARFVVEQSATGQVSPRPGNRHEEYVPHGIFPCVGDDRWLTIAVRSDTEWQSLCQVMRRPDLAADPFLASIDGRRKNEDRIEQAVASWAKSTKGDSAMANLQALGVPAAIARVPRDLLADPQLVTSGHWQVVERPFIGPHLMPTVSYRENNSVHPAPIRMAAPTLGQHNSDILSGLLGVSDAELTSLEQRGIIGTEVIQPAAAPARKAASN